jgi:uncharacterized protein (DUF1778 family)
MAMPPAEKKHRTTLAAAKKTAEGKKPSPAATVKSIKTGLIKKTPRRDEAIQIRATAETKALLNQASALRGQKLSEFMLESARRTAEETILEQRHFLLDPIAHEKFLAMLDAPAIPDMDVRARLRRKPLWER